MPSSDQDPGFMSRKGGTRPFLLYMSISIAINTSIQDAAYVKLLPKATSKCLYFKFPIKARYGSH